jgi:F-type H+-transporting ATPase subunit gamma
MPSLKDVRNNIRSVQSTQKITKAMQMVATSKMRKTQQKMRDVRPYSQHISRLMSNLARLNPTVRISNPFLRIDKANSSRKVGIIVITSDKGLCGSLNSNNVKVVYEQVQKLKLNKIEVVACALGQKGYNGLKRVGIDIKTFAIGLGDIPQMEKIVGPLSYFLNEFHNNQLSELHVVYSEFINTMKQQTVYRQLLPLTDNMLTPNTDKNVLAVNDYEYEPSSTVVLNQLVRRYIEAVVFQCLADNMASEQAARMVAMKSATDNASNAINNLRLIYNKTRQATITKELSEIVAGSDAV